MKFDYIVIGGGLCGLTAGIRLASKNKKVAIVSSGQSALHFSSGAFGLYGYNNGELVETPLEDAKSLPASHPYSIIGTEMQALTNDAKTLLEKAGINLNGESVKNHFTLTPFGEIRPSWLTLKEFPVFNDPQTLPFDKVLAINLKGFLESYPSFLAENLGKSGVAVRVETIDLERLNNLRKSHYDMRTISVAKHIDTATIEELANKINSIAGKSETVLIPAIIGLNNSNQIDRLRELVKNELYCIPTLPISVGGVRSQTRLEQYFESLGGTFLLGDHVTKGIIEGGNVKYLVTTNLGDDHLEAEAYILATGSYLCEGLLSDPNGFKEPVFGLDVKYPANRDEWYSENFFASQPYMSYGVEVNNEFHPIKDGMPVNNLYAAGSILGHCNSLEEDSGAGCAMLTGLYTADLATK